MGGRDRHLPGDRQAAIRCPVGLFPRQEAEIVRLTREINQARTADERAPWAQELTDTVDVLLSCEHYDEDRVNCHLCRNFSELRHKTAALVVKAGRLSR